MLKNVLRKISKNNLKKYYSSGHLSVADIPLSQYFSGTPEPVNAEAAQDLVLQSDRTYETTILENGFTVQSTDYNQSANTVISLVVNSGSRFESYKASGISHFIQKFFFDNTNTRSKLRLTAEMQKTGGNISSSSDRENIVYRTESVREAVPKLLTLMSDSVLQGRLHSWDLQPQQAAIEQDIQDFASSPEVLLNEALHRTAFNGKNLGNPLICPTYNVNKITIDDIVEHMDSFFNPARMTLVGTNINHEDLVYLSHQLFGEFPEGTNTDNESLEVGKSLYSGGDFAMHQSKYQAHDPAAQSVLAFRGVGNSDNDVFALEVLKNLLGQTKNLKSRRTFGTQGVLRNNIVNKLGESAGVINEAAAFNINYSDDGLFGVKFTGDGNAVGESLEKTFDLLNVVANKGVCDMNLNRGINKAKFNYFSNLETSVGVHEAQMAYANLENEDFGASLGKVTSEDLQRVTGNLLKNKPTLVSYGELAGVPNLFDMGK